METKLPRTHPSAVVLLTRSQLVSALGDGAYYVTSVLYFTSVVGLAPTDVGVGLTIAWGAGFACATPLGMLADRIGLRAGAVVLALSCAAGLAMLVYARSLTAFVGAATVYAVAQSGLGAVRQALVAVLVDPRERVTVRARLQVVVNTGLSVGAACGGLALAVGTPTAYRIVLGIDAATFVVAAVLLVKLPAARRDRRRERGVDGAPRATTAPRSVLHDTRYLVATGLNAVLCLYMPVLSVLIPLWVARRTAAPPWLVGALFVANTLGVVVLQRASALRVDGLRSAGRSLVTGSLLLAGGCAVLATAPIPHDAVLASAWLLLAAALLVMGEVRVAAGSWEIGFGLADPDRPGQWQGMYSSSIPIARAIGPICLLGLVFGVPADLGWGVIALLFAAAGAALAGLAVRADAGAVTFGLRRTTRSRSGSLAP